MEIPEQVRMTEESPPDRLCRIKASMWKRRRLWTMLGVACLLGGIVIFSLALSKTSSFHRSSNDQEHKSDHQDARLGPEFGCRSVECPGSDEDEEAEDLVQDEATPTPSVPLVPSAPGAPSAPSAPSAPVKSIVVKEDPSV